MGCMKSLLIDQLDDQEEFRLAFETEEDERIEPDWPDDTVSFSPIPSTITNRSDPHETSIPF